MAGADETGSDGMPVFGRTGLPVTGSLREHAYISGEWVAVVAGRTSEAGLGAAGPGRGRHRDVRVRPRGALRPALGGGRAEAPGGRGGGWQGRVRRGGAGAVGCRRGMVRAARRRVRGPGRAAR